MIKTATLLMALCAILPFNAIAQELAAVTENELDTAEAVDNLENLKPSIVRIRNIIRTPDLLRPWTRQPQQEATGTGVIIEHNGETYILTNAHVVAYSSRLYVQGFQESERYLSEVVAYSSEMDLALVRITEDTEEFYSTRNPLPFTDTLATPGQTVNALGYPVGGDEMSTTSGIVSRIEVAGYDGCLGLRIQVDAALNPGNSGGPAIIDDKIAGLVFSGVSSADNIGYVIPTEEIKRFLDDADDGTYNGKRNMDSDAILQAFENDALREHLNVGEDITGVFVSPTTRNEDPADLLAWDIITHIGDVAIDNQGMSHVREDVRGYFGYLADQLSAETGIIPLTVWRDGAEVNLEIPAATETDKLLPQLYINNAQPRYLVWGPMVFTQATKDITNYIPSHLMLSFAEANSELAIRTNDTPAFEGEELLILSQPLLDHDIVRGYSDCMLQCLESVNGIEVRNLEHLAEIMDTTQEDTLIFVFGENEEILVFDRNDLMLAHEEILEDNSIRSSRSRDLPQEQH